MISETPLHMVPASSYRHIYPVFNHVFLCRFFRQISNPPLLAPASVNEIMTWNILAIWSKTRFTVCSKALFDDIGSDILT
jgi:hypothetical protein